MKNIKIENLKEGFALTDDSYILNNLFFMPKNLPLQNYHIDLLKRWEIKEVLTGGDISESEILNKIISLFILNPKYQFKIDNTPPISINFPVISSTIIDQCLEIIELLYNVSQKLDV